VITATLIALVTAGAGFLLGSNRFFFGGLAATAVLLCIQIMP
jgi:hypothetical protein